MVYTLDTNIIIALFQGDAGVERTIRAWQRAGIPIVTSVITLTELLAFPKITKGEEERLKDFLQTTRNVAITWPIAELAAHIRKQYGVKIADSLIAATAWHESTTLVTRNLKDFRKVKELSVQAL